MREEWKIKNIYFHIVTFSLGLNLIDLLVEDVLNLMLKG